MTPLAEIEVIGSQNRATFEAVVDTAFSGFVCIPLLIGQTLGLELRSIHPMELANGQMVSELVFDAQVRFLGRSFRVPILMSDSGIALIGNNLLEDCKLTIDYPKQTIRIVRKDL
jgi:clan AA aspartic protease